MFLLSRMNIYTKMTSAEIENIHTHTYIHKFSHTYINTNIHINTCTHAHTGTYT